MEDKQYLGDGVYASTDGYMIELTTGDGIKTDNMIMLEPSVISALVSYSRANMNACPI